jgi:gluconate 2-dehydrogenase gamma chain
MSAIHSTRRDFLTESSRAASAAWLAARLPWLTTLAACARDDARWGDGFTNLTGSEARAMRAFAAQIIPSDDGAPGAEEAEAAHFVDQALGTPFFRPSAPVIRAGLADLDRRARAVGGTSGFASLPVGRQIDLIRQIESGEFFKLARTLVIIGTFGDPSHGGNRGRVGWTMIGIDHRPSYGTPFGWYDGAAAPGGSERAR